MIGIRNKKEKGVSLMVSYILLISIGLIMAVSIFSWLRYVANVEPVVSCEDGSSIIILETNCRNDVLELTLKNNGRFNLEGVLVTVGDNSDRVPIDPIVPVSGVDSKFIFDSLLKPDETVLTFFDTSKLSYEYIRNIRVIPLIVTESGDRVVCTDSVVKEDIRNCRIKV